MTVELRASSPPSPIAPAFRRPLPAYPIERHTLSHPALPPPLHGFTILHLTDFHVTRPGRSLAIDDRLAAAVAAETVDLVVLTGDYMTRPGQEAAAAGFLERLASCWRSRFGAFGIFGNHDSSELIRRLRDRTDIKWLRNQAVRIPDLPLTILGLSYPEDLMSSVLDEPDEADRFRILLAHYPTEIYPAASAGIPLMLAGHTHGGQLRFSTRLAPHTSCDLPATLASGVLRLRGTLCAISRGLGEAVINLRWNCPPQAPIYTLTRGPMAESNGRARLHRVTAW